MFCPQCATPNADDVKFCRSCGRELEAVALIVSGKSAGAGKKDTNKIEPKSKNDWLEKQIEGWKKTAARYRSEPETGEGSEELMKRAKHAEHLRDEAMAKYHHYEVASAAFQIGIVLASATIITGMIVLAWGSALLALLGIGFTLIGLFAPHAVHLM